MAAKWYVVHTYSGQETKVHQYLSELVQSGEMGDQIKQVLMPTQDVVQVKNGKKLKTTRKFFPSYVLVEMELTKETLHIVRNTAGVTGFIGGNKPQALRDEEVREYWGRLRKSPVSKSLKFRLKLVMQLKLKKVHLRTSMVLSMRFILKREKSK